MPTPKPNEGRDAFLDRCIPIVIDEGRDPDQAVAICLAYYEGEEDSADARDVSDRKALWYALDRKARTFDDKYISKFRKAFREDLEYLTKASSIAQLKDRPAMAKFESQIREMYFDVGESFAKQGYNQHRKQKNAPDFRNFIRDFYEERGIETTKQVVDTLHKDIIRDVVKAQSSGASFDDIKKGVVAKYFPKGVGETGSQVDWRVKRVVRTEVHAVSSYAQQRGVEQTGITYHKEWISVPDMRRRSHHAEADGQKVSLDEPYYVGGENIQFPGDGSARNAVNCRCREVYIQSDEVEPQDERAIDRIDDGNIAPDPRDPKSFELMDDIGVGKKASKRFKDDFGDGVDFGFPASTDPMAINTAHRVMQYVTANVGQLKYMKVQYRNRASASTFGTAYNYDKFKTGKGGQIQMSPYPKLKPGEGPNVVGRGWSRFTEDILRQGEIGHFFKGSAPDGILMHEMGHAMAFQIYMRKRGYMSAGMKMDKDKIRANIATLRKDLIDDHIAGQDLVEQAYARLGIEQSKRMAYRQDLYKTFGEYSKTNPDELFAMAIEYEYGYPGKNKFAQTLMTILFEEYKKVIQ